MIGFLRRLVHGRDRDEPRDSDAALAHARKARAAAEARQPAVTAVVAPIRRALAENHFAERIEAAYAIRRGAAP